MSDEQVPDPAVDPELEPEGRVGPEDLVPEHGSPEREDDGVDRDHRGDDDDEQVESD